MNQVVLTTAVLFALIGTVFYMAASGNETKEGFWMTPGRQVKVEKMFKNTDTHDFFQVPNFQARMSPRFSNVDYGANLRTNFPNYNQMGVPQDPLLQEKPNHRDQYQRGSIPLDPHNPYSAAYANGDYTNTVAEQTSFMNEDGEMKQPIVYDRYMYANRNSRLRGQGDPIRGDLPIVPISGDWFIPSAAAGNNINQVLQQGAMNVMGGVNNETNNSLANLIYNTSGGAETTIGGIDMAQTTMNHQVYGAASAAMGDVQMTSFP